MLLVAAGARTSFFPAAVSAGSITGQALSACARGWSVTASAAAGRRGSAPPLPRILQVSFQHYRNQQDRESSSGPPTPPAGSLLLAKLLPAAKTQPANRTGPAKRV